MPRQLQNIKNPAIFFAEADGKIFGVNKECERMFSISASNINQSSYSLFSIFQEINSETEHKFIVDEGCIFKNSKYQMGELFSNE